MALRRFTLAIDNHPAYGVLFIEDISRSGTFQIETGWTPQAAIVSLSQQFNLPPEFIPTSGATLYRLDQASPGGLTYDIYDDVGVTGGSPATVSSMEHIGVVSPTNDMMVSPRSWYLYTSGSGEADQVVLTVGDLTTEADLYAISHVDDEVEGELIYFGAGTDVSATYGLAAGTRWETATGTSSEFNIAEMVFVDGDQVEGDIYDPSYYGYGGGAYDLIITDDGAVHIKFETPVDVSSKSLMFAIFDRLGEPQVYVRSMDDDHETALEPFEPIVDDDGTVHRGVKVRFRNFPKGDALISYYIV